MKNKILSIALASVLFTTGIGLLPKIAAKADDTDAVKIIK